jgi:hypothetical protein
MNSIVVVWVEATRRYGRTVPGGRAGEPTNRQRLAIERRDRIRIVVVRFWDLAFQNRTLHRIGISRKSWPSHCPGTASPFCPLRTALTLIGASSTRALHPVPTADPNGLVVVTEVAPSAPRADESEMAPANFVDLARRNRSFDQLAAFTDINANLTGIDEPERVAGFRVTPSYFHVLGIGPALGRVFSDDDARYTSSPNAVILSDGLWRRFGADPSIIGQKVD